MLGFATIIPVMLTFLLPSCARAHLSELVDDTESYINGGYKRYHKVDKYYKGGNVVSVVFVREGEKLSLSCSLVANGTDSQRILWQKKAENIEEKETDLPPGKYLEIDAATISDRGLYYCKDPSSDSIRTFRVNVYGCISYPYLLMELSQVIQNSMNLLWNKSSMSNFVFSPSSFYQSIYETEAVSYNVDENTFNDWDYCVQPLSARSSMGEFLLDKTTVRAENELFFNTTQTSLTAEINENDTSGNFTENIPENDTDSSNSVNATQQIQVLLNFSWPVARENISFMHRNRYRQIVAAVQQTAFSAYYHKDGFGRIVQIVLDNKVKVYVYLPVRNSILDTSPEVSPESLLATRFYDLVVRSQKDFHPMAVKIQMPQISLCQNFGKGDITDLFGDDDRPKRYSTFQMQAVHLNINASSDAYNSAGPDEAEAIDFICDRSFYILVLESSTMSPLLLACIKDPKNER